MIIIQVARVLNEDLEEKISVDKMAYVGLQVFNYPVKIILKNHVLPT